MISQIQLKRKIEKVNKNLKNRELHLKKSKIKNQIDLSLKKKFSKLNQIYFIVIIKFF